MSRFNGKTALITGGTSGIGFATANALLEQGAKVAISGTTSQSVDRALKRLPDGAIGTAARVERLADIDRLVAFVRDAFGALDLLVLCAAVSRVKPLAEMTEDDYEAIFGANVKGTFFTVQKAAPLLRGGGSVVLISSGAAEMGRVGRGLYAASKAATRQLARSLAAELVHKGVRVNAVSPGPTITPFTRGANQTEEQQRAALDSMVPLGHAAQPADIADAILYLLSDDARFVLGSELVVDGGWRQLGEVPPPRT